MLLREPNHLATRTVPLSSPFHLPPSYSSTHRIRPLPIYPLTSHGTFADSVPFVATSSSSTALHSYAPSIQQVAAAVTPSAATTVSFLRLAIVFVAGGLFFSSAVAAATACYAIGMDNIRRLKEMTKIVWESVWLTFTMGLSSTKQTLMGTTTTTTTNDQPSLWQRYKQAWSVLRCKLGETRRKAVEGVQAIQREVRLCAAAVGPPGLIPLQYMLDHQLHFTIAEGIQEGLRGALKGVQMSNIGLQLSHFDVGNVAPKLEAARVYDLGDDAMAFDFDLKWESELKATIRVHSSSLFLPPTLPVTLHNVRFRGPVRVVMTPMTRCYPGFGALLVSFPSMPEIGLDLRVAGGDVTQVVPMLRAEILTAIETSIANAMMWPKRVVVPSYPIDDATTPILSLHELKQLETIDPMLRAEESLGSRPVMRRKLNQMSELLSTDHELVQSIVDLPLPSFQADKKADVVVTATSQPIVGVVLPPMMDWMEQGSSRLLEQLQHAHQMVVERQQQDMAKTQKMIQQSKLWNDVQKLQHQTKEQLQKLQWKTS